MKKKMESELVAFRNTIKKEILQAHYPKPVHGGIVYRRVAALASYLIF